MSVEYLDRLRADDEPGRLRRAALDSFYAAEVEPTSLVEFSSAGAALVIYRFRAVGDEERALDLAASLPAPLKATLLITGVAPGDDFELKELAAARGVRLETAVGVVVEGYLGNFAVQCNGPDLDLARRVLDRPGFDLIVDAQPEPLLRHEIVPPGYLHLAGDAAAVATDLAELAELVGEFQKPKFVNYDPDLCAHTRNGKIGCTRCLDACPTGALTSAAESIEVDVHLCQGAGPCATVCPSGAISYQYPPGRDTLTALRAALLQFSDQGRPPVVLIHDSESGLAEVSAVAADLPSSVVPVQVEETGTVGAEFWLAALAWGAGAIRHHLPADTAAGVRQALTVQQRWVRTLLQGLGWPGEAVELVESPALAGPWPEPERVLAPARHMAFAGKRNNLELALDHLAGAQAEPQPVELAEAPFGRVLVDSQRCTLCMACVSACPGKALLDGAGEPRLRLIEANCLQCGVCQVTCPESAIGLQSRWNPDANARRAVVVLHEDEPLNCVSCGKPFGNRRMVEALQQRLGDHWMYRNAQAARRLQMCEDCRIKDIYKQGGADFNVYDRN